MDKSANLAKGASADDQQADQAQPSNPTLARESSSTSLRRKNSEPTRQMPPVAATVPARASANPSPLGSREASPNRPTMRSGPSKAASTSGLSGTRSRKNSQQDMSPSRKASIPGTSVQRTISASTTPTLLPSSSETTIRAPVPQKPQLATEHSHEGPKWPVSARLRSPPPGLNKPNLAATRKLDQETPTISLQRSTPSPNPQVEALRSDSDADDLHLQPGMRTPGRGGSGSTPTLATVEEASPLASPQRLDAALEKLEESYGFDAVPQPDPSDNAARAVRSRPELKQYESGSETGSIKAPRRTTTASAPPPLTSRQSSTTGRLNVVKGKPGEAASLQSMTVETETVTSIPQVVVASAGLQVPSGSIRVNSGTDTVKPKKDKKKAGRKQTAVAPGTVSSKADNFEAKIASAVDEADTSDSDETFVYDSNPPDNRDRPQRFHSRTPSATSMASQVDRTGMRSIHSVLDGPGPIAGGKRSMKFVNTFNSSGNDSGAADEEGKGTTRTYTSSTRATGRHHHHIGRWARNVTSNGHPSLFDNESPFPLNAARSKLGVHDPGSNKSTSGRGTSNGKRGFPLNAGYDLDETTGADDETTPLIPSIRYNTNRSPRNRRSGYSSVGSLERQGFRQPPSLLNRFATCLVVAVMVLLVVSGAIGFMFATSQPLEQLELIKITNVIASEQELMLDIMVRAHNPNVIVISVDAGELDVFVKSPNAGTDSEWWRRPRRNETWAAERDAGNEVDTLEDESGDKPKAGNSTILLGRVWELDSPLSFEGSFFHHGLSVSTAGLRLLHPANETEGGAERWERILEDEFVLMVKGPLRYSLPLSQRVRSTQITGRVTVKPNAPSDPSLRPNSTADFTTS